MIHFDIPCFLVFPWTFYPWISWWTLHIFPKKQKQSHLWIKCGWNPQFWKYEMPWNAMKCPQTSPTPKLLSQGTARCLRSSLCPQGSISASGGAWRFSWLQTAASSALASSVPKTCGVSRGFAHGIPWDFEGKTMEKPGKTIDFSTYQGFLHLFPSNSKKTCETKELGDSI